MNFPIFKKKCKKTEKIFITILGITLGILSIKVFAFSSINISNISVYILLLLLFCSLLFLAYFDFKKMEVHNTVSLVLTVLLSILNVLLFILKIKEIIILDSWGYNPYNNIMGALILGSIFQLIVLITKEKGLGQGDVRIALITGLLIGLNNLLAWSYITIFTALIYGLFLAVKSKRFKNTKIPLVPFMVLGAVTIILFNL